MIKTVKQFIEKTNYSRSNLPPDKVLLRSIKDNKINKHLKNTILSYFLYSN